MLLYHYISCRIGYKKLFVLLIIIIYAIIGTLLTQLNTPMYGKHEEISVTPRLDSSTQFSSSNTKYILLWTNASASPFVYMGTGNKIFLSRRCQWTNCFVTNNRAYLGHYSEFEVILFNGPQLSEIAYTQDIPQLRSSRQKYVYANIESAANYPILNNLWNGFFNWTWTYRLDSDAVWGYIVVRNSSYLVVGPSNHVQWMKLNDMKPISDVLKTSLKSKKRCAAWFVSNCNTVSKREDMVKDIQTELGKYGLQVDIYGDCGKLKCPREIMNECLEILERDYYFYFVFENACSEDYVTEKLIIALQSNTVPVVYGGANYSKFMPGGIYLDALKLGPKTLAKKMFELMKSPEEYYKLFKWKNHYSYHYRRESPDTDEYCSFCAMLNDENLMKTKTVYESLEAWWMRPT